LINDHKHYKETLYNTISISAILEVRLEVLAFWLHLLNGDEAKLNDDPDLIPINFKAKNAEVFRMLKNYNSELHKKYGGIKSKLDSFSTYRNDLVHCSLRKNVESTNPNVVLEMRKVRIFENMNAFNNSHIRRYTQLQIDDYGISAYKCIVVMEEILAEIQKDLLSQEITP
jgi:hypothetical protein